MKYRMTSFPLIIQCDAWFTTYVILCNYFNSKLFEKLISLKRTINFLLIRYQHIYNTKFKLRNKWIQTSLIKEINVMCYSLY